MIRRCISVCILGVAFVAAWTLFRPVYAQYPNGGPAFGSAMHPGMSAQPPYPPMNYPPVGAYPGAAPDGMYGPPMMGAPSAGVPGHVMPVQYAEPMYHGNAPVLLNARLSRESEQMAAGPPTGDASPFDLFRSGNTSGFSGPLTVNDSQSVMIDNAIVGTQYRFRFDHGNGVRLPDRAEYFWGQSGALTGNVSPTPEGPPRAETGVDYNDLKVYFEHAPLSWISGFVEVPTRFLNPEQNNNAVGLGDVNAGIKIALLACPDNYLTFQLRVYTPSGESDRGLGTGHVSIEPALLYYRQLHRNIDFWGEVRGLIPLSKAQGPDNEDYAGDVIQYGLGGSIDLLTYCDSCKCGWGLNENLSLIGEMVGWSIVDGQALEVVDFSTARLLDVRGDNFLNGSFGIRYTRNRHSFGVSFDKAITGDAWYDEMLRFEHRIAF